MIKRELYLKKIEPFIDKQTIKVITGVRRSGKSTFLQQIVEKLENSGVKKENIIMINLELQKYLDIENRKQLGELIDSKLPKNSDRKYLFLDEIQDVEGWERLVNAYLAEDLFDIYVTGSNSKLLSGELATYLTGRHIEIKIFPFSFSEFLKYKETNENIQDLRYSDYEDLFLEYIRFGGMPFTLGFGYEERVQILDYVYNSILLKDVVKRNDVRDINLLNRILMFTMGNVGQLFSANSVVKYLKNSGVNISTHTVYKYLDYIEDACLINTVKREDLIGKKILNYIEKYYVVDLGFREYLFGRNEEDLGQCLENIVYYELIRRGYRVTIGKFKNKEIDFVCKKLKKTIYIQVSYILFDENTIKREFDTLNKIDDNYPKYVLSMDRVDMSRNGIKHLNIINFLKDEIEL